MAFNLSKNPVESDQPTDQPNNYRIISTKCFTSAYMLRNENKFNSNKTAGHNTKKMDTEDYKINN